MIDLFQIISKISQLLLEITYPVLIISLIFHIKIIEISKQTGSSFANIYWTYRTIYWTENGHFLFL